MLFRVGSFRRWVCRLFGSGGVRDLLASIFVLHSRIVRAQRVTRARGMRRLYVRLDRAVVEPAGLFLAYNISSTPLVEGSVYLSLGFWLGLL